MSSITLPNTFVPGQVLTATQLNQDFQTIYTDYDGNITNVNIAGGAAISLSKLNLNSAAISLQTAGAISWAAGTTGDSQPRVAMTSDGRLEFGVGGSTAPDVSFIHSATNTVQLNNGASGAAILDMNTGSIINATLGGTSTASFTALTVTTSFTNTGIYAGNSPFATGNYRIPPTTGTLTGEYWTSGNWATTGTITFNNVRLHVGGNITISNPITINTELTNGAGFGGGYIFRPNSGAGWYSGYGASYGGQGGRDANSLGQPTSTYSMDNYLGGSAGTNGDSLTAFGGAGGGSLYVECTGNVTVSANITANGGTGTTGTGSQAGGGGSGGGIDIRSLGTVTIAGGVTIAANGGAGGTNGAGGGGGGGGCIRIRCATLSNSGTITVSGGAAGGGGTPTAGATGFTDILASTIGPRMLG